ncbi:spore coat protein [Bacillus sp. 1P06AnD]|uniref:spore coat protein n=1 Tax=Bacillus sp. 1P06AnD TaxID=3132208 RepID=UPI0039A0C943
MKQLAWHETLELHELIAMQSSQLISLKKTIGTVHDPELKGLYEKAITQLEKNLRELISFIPLAQQPREDERDSQTGSQAGSLLGMAKSWVKSYAAALTETATPQLRMVLKNQLNHAIDLHAAIFEFMFKNGFYPAYNIEQLLQNDVSNARKALNM